MTLNNKVLTVQEVADILKMNVVTVYEFIHQGELQAIKISRSYRVLEYDLEKFIQNHKTTNSS